ncbi:BPSS1780 family membrane protein [Pseudoalteromonas sp. YIC-656]|uniref:BPSS1780 family membrane protein n=1 Tax=Pseudoalteromonas pernae TaxID=3118054 RepID=UPI0032428D7B
MAIEIKVYKASAGARWFKAGLDVFQTQPFIFMFMYLFIGIFGLIGLIAPVLKIPAALATPFLMAGLYGAALRRQQGQKIAFADILNVFSQKGRRIGLFRVGLYQMGAALLLGMLASVLFADVIELMTQTDLDPQTALQQLAQSFSFGSLALFLIAVSIYLCAFAFAVPLVYFGRHTSIIEVMKASLMAFYHNMAALSVYGLIAGGLLLVCAFLSFIPLLVVMPICYISLFIAFQAMFMPQLHENGQDDHQSGQSVKGQNSDAQHSANEQDNTSSNGRFDA